MLLWPTYTASQHNQWDWSNVDRQRRFDGFHQQFGKPKRREQFSDKCMYSMYDVWPFFQNNWIINSEQSHVRTRLRRDDRLCRRLFDWYTWSSEHYRGGIILWKTVGVGFKKYFIWKQIFWQMRCSSNQRWGSNENHAPLRWHPTVNHTSDECV